MPFGEKVNCYKCNKEESFMWHPSNKGILCNECNETEVSSAVKVKDEPKEKVPEIQPEKPKEKPVEKPKEEPKISTPVEKNKSPSKRNTRSKTNRSCKTRQTQNSVSKSLANKERGRRSIFKKNPPTKLPSARATCVTVNHVTHEGQQYRIGDIVSVRGTDLCVYYAQIKGLMIDEYCEKSASITWLLPTQTKSAFTRKGFDPMTYIIGPDDDTPRKIECLEFVMHAPSDYYRSNCPCPSGEPAPLPPGFIWTRLQMPPKKRKHFE